MSNRYGTVIVSGGRGVKRECILDGTPKPGTCMTVKAATEPVNGVFTFTVYNRDADANRATVAVLLEDELQGYGLGTAYVTGKRGMLYYPEAGDHLQMLVANLGGTGEAFAIGDYLLIDDGTGLLVDTTGTPEMESFIVMETVTGGITEDTYVLVEYTGH
jgi:hypothetical protein